MIQMNIPFLMILNKVFTIAKLKKIGPSQRNMVEILLYSTRETDVAKYKGYNSWYRKHQWCSQTGKTKEKLRSKRCILGTTLTIQN